MKQLLLSIITLILFSVGTNAQSFFASRQKRALVLVAGTGTSTYYGELSNPGDYLDAKPNLLIGLQYLANNRIGIRSEVTWFQLSGSDAKAGDPSRVPRNLDFNANNFEINAVGIFNLLPSGMRFYQRPAFNLYGFAGVGLLYFNPTTEYQGTRYALRPLRTELVDYNRTTLVVPYGLGGRIKLGPFINLSLEGGLRKTFTDYLDDVSTTHKDASRFSDPIALALSDRRPEIGIARVEEGHIRGNPEKNDAYFLLNLKLEYYLPGDFLTRNKLYNVKRKNYLRRSRAGRAKSR